MNDRFVPTILRTFEGRQWKALASGQHHSLALDADGTIPQSLTILPSSQLHYLSSSQFLLFHSYTTSVPHISSSFTATQTSWLYYKQTDLSANHFNQ